MFDKINYLIDKINELNMNDVQRMNYILKSGFEISTCKQRMKDYKGKVFPVLDGEGKELGCISIDGVFFQKNENIIYDFKNAEFSVGFYDDFKIDHIYVNGYSISHIIKDGACTSFIEEKKHTLLNEINELEKNTWDKKRINRLKEMVESI